MTFQELRKIAYKKYYPALVLEKVFSHQALRRSRIVFGYVSIILLLAGLALNLAGEFSKLAPFVKPVFGLACISFGIWLILAAIQAFYYSYYFRSIYAAEMGQIEMPFELAHLLYRTAKTDPLLSFMKSNIGRTILHRTGIHVRDIAAFIAKRNAIIDASVIDFPEGTENSVAEYVGSLYDTDRSFAKLLFSGGISRKDFLAIAQWVVDREEARKTKERWWSKEELGRIPGLGKNWSYGQIQLVENFSIEIPIASVGEYSVHDIAGTTELMRLEQALCEDKSANAIIVGDDRDGAVSLISRLDRMIENGNALSPLQHKRLIMLDTERIVSAGKTKGDFDELCIKIFNEAKHAGNVILVLEDFAAFISACDSFGIDIVSLLDPYLLSRDLHIIALIDRDRFFSKVEKNVALMERFEKIALEEVDEYNTVKVLENEIVPIEQSSKVFFTFPALAEIAESADRYFPEGVMPEKAVRLLGEIVPRILGLGREVVRKEDVMKLIRNKTGIPMGEVTKEEQSKLINLEKILHQRVIGQDEAVDAIANAVRRARSGINNPARPMASFLFLGPTGVGKTETTKALGEVFFGDNAPLLRLDMSEYSGPDALPKLIGVFGSNQPGVLSTMLREHPYGVLLLDEFEKTTGEVMNLFLQIIDEGIFSDMEGKHVNARNLLIIATSNAGSEMIWDAVKRHDDLNTAKEGIIEEIIKSHVMKPELLNRFDGVIIFHPLGNEHLEKIARLQLEKLEKRLAEKGIYLVINDELIKYLMKYGTDPKFGARPMNRAIQDKIEQAIAEKMIRGEAKPGSEITLTEKDLT